MDPNRRLSLLRKLVTRVSDALQDADIEVTPPMLREARDMIERCWFQSGSVSEKQLGEIVDTVCSRHGAETRAERRKRQKMRGMAGTPQPGGHAAMTGQQQQQAMSSKTADEAPLPPVQPPRSMSAVPPSPERIFETTKQQRRNMADREWNAVFDADSRAAEQIKTDTRDRRDRSRQFLKTGLEHQLEDHQRKREEERLRRIREQKEMDAQIAQMRAEKEEERLREKERAMHQKEFQESQTAENARLRQARRQLDRDEQLRQLALVEAQEQADRERDQAKRKQQRSQWKTVLEQNVQNFHDAKHERAKKMAEDREIIRLMNENFDKEERQRAEAKARKEARREFFGKLASSVADKIQSKEQKHLDKIEREAEQEDDRAAREKAARIAAMKQRAADTKIMLDEQKRQKAIREEQEAREAEALAAAIKKQADDEKERQRAAKAQQREEALKQRKFLDSQLQMQYMREAQPMETSIFRPRNQTWNEHSSTIRSRLQSRASQRSNTPAGGTTERNNFF